MTGRRDAHTRPTSLKLPPLGSCMCSPNMTIRPELPPQAVTVLQQQTAMRHLVCSACTRNPLFPLGLACHPDQAAVPVTGAGAWCVRARAVPDVWTRAMHCAVQASLQVHPHGLLVHLLKARERHVAALRSPSHARSSLSSVTSLPFSFARRRQHKPSPSIDSAAAVATEAQDRGGGSRPGGGSVRRAPPASVSRRLRTVRLESLRRYPAAEIMQFAGEHRAAMAALRSAAQRAAAERREAAAAGAAAVAAPDAAAAVFRQLEERRRRPPPGRLRPLASVGDWPRGQPLRGPAPVLGAVPLTAAAGAWTLARQGSAPVPSALPSDRVPSAAAAGVGTPPSQGGHGAEPEEVGDHSWNMYEDDTLQQPRSLYSHRALRTLGSPASALSSMSEQPGFGPPREDVASEARQGTVDSMSMDGRPVDERARGVGEGLESARPRGPMHAAAVVKFGSQECSGSASDSGPRNLDAQLLGEHGRSAGSSCWERWEGTTMGRGGPVWNGGGTSCSGRSSVSELEDRSHSGCRVAEGGESPFAAESHRQRLYRSGLGERPGSEAERDGVALNLDESCSGSEDVTDAEAARIRWLRSASWNGEGRAEERPRGLDSWFRRLSRVFVSPRTSRVVPVAASATGSAASAVRRSIAQSFTGTLRSVSALLAGRSLQVKLKELRQLEEEIAEGFIVAEVERLRQGQLRFAAHLRSFLAAHPELKGEVEAILGGLVWEDGEAGGRGGGGVAAVGAREGAVVVGGDVKGVGTRTLTRRVGATSGGGNDWDAGTDDGEDRRCVLILEVYACATHGSAAPNSRTGDRAWLARLAVTPPCMVAPSVGPADVWQSAWHAAGCICGTAVMRAV